MPERVCEICGRSDATNEGVAFDPRVGGVEIWSWTEAGRFRCFCRAHVPKRKLWRRMR